MSLTQTEADYLMALEKQFATDEVLELGDTPLEFSRALVSLDGREYFIFDVWRGSLNLKKYKLQERARVVIPLVRVDVGGAPHTNPDDTVVPCPHLHLYREGYDDKWAFPLSKYPFREPSDIVITVEDFAQFCKISRLPQIQRRMV
jgi:hypothetical protein